MARDSTLRRMRELTCCVWAGTARQTWRMEENYKIMMRVF